MEVFVDLFVKIVKGLFDIGHHGFFAKDLYGVFELPLLKNAQKRTTTKAYKKTPSR
jgi:hypothetical protein